MKILRVAIDSYLSNKLTETHGEYDYFLWQEPTQTKTIQTKTAKCSKELMITRRLLGHSDFQRFITHANK